jgi:predicted Zn-dependent peptidase
MYKKQILKNGVRLLTIPQTGAKTFAILVMVKTGSGHEGRKQNGISHFVEHMLFKGTKKRPTTLAISSALDIIGGEFNAFTSKEYTGYYAKVAARHAREAIDVISDMLLHSKFNEQEIERERGVIIEELNMYENNPLIHIDNLFESCLYGDTPAGWETIGTRENINAFQRSDFLDYVASQYRGKHIVVGLAGVVPEAVIAFTRREFAKLPAGQGSDVFQFSGTQNGPEIKIKQQAGGQVNTSVGFRAFGYNHDDYYAAKLLAIILGGSMSSRLFIAVRERAGLAYQVHTQMEGYAYDGYLTTTIGTSADKLEQALQVTLQEYTRIARTPVTSKELRKAKEYLKGRTTIDLEESENINTWYVRQELLQTKVIAPETFFAKIDALTPRDILRAAKGIVSSIGLNLAAIGSGIDEKALKKVLKI